MNDFREYSAAFYDRNELYHWGVKGMKWGVIRWKDKFNNLLERYRRSNSFGDNRDTSNDKVMDKQSVRNVGNQAIRDGTRKFSNKFRDESQKLKQLGQKTTDTKEQNKIFSNSKDYMDKSKELKKMNDLYGRNCPKTTLALEFKKRGIEVNPKAKTKPISTNAIFDMYVNEKVTECKNKNDFYNAKNYGKPGDHGAIRGSREKGAGHIFNYTVLKDGTVQLEDAQNGQVMSLEEAKRTNSMNINGFTSGHIINLTNAEIDMDEVRKYDMFTVNMNNGNDMKLKQYERNVKRYIQNKKRAEKWMRNIAKGINTLKKLFKR